MSRDYRQLDAQQIRALLEELLARAATEGIEVDGLLASQTALLAMKMARYARKDYADITALIRSLNLTSPEQIVNLTYEVLGEDSTQHQLKLLRTQSNELHSDAA